MDSSLISTLTFSTSQTPGHDCNVVHDVDVTCLRPFFQFEEMHACQCTMELRAGDVCKSSDFACECFTRFL